MFQKVKKFAKAQKPRW